MQKLVFFFPWPEVSGGPFYLARLANAVAEAGVYKVYYTDYPNGLCESLIAHRDIEVLKYCNEGEKFKIFPDEPVILVMPVYWAHMVPQVHPQTKVVFFNWHNECISVLKRDWCASDSFINKFLGLVYQTSSVFFCDKTHLMAQNTDEISFKEEYVPIISSKRKMIARSKLVKENERNIAILGRLCKDKIYAVLDLLDNIVALRDFVKINVYVIGEGDHQKLLYERKYPAHINIIQCGTMDIDNVIALLSKKVDILFAMGTSVLEGATIRLPSVILPNDIKPFKCNQYPYLYESKGYALGWYPEQIDELGLPVHTVGEIFCDIYEKKQKEQIGMKCYEYYLENHSDNLRLFLTALDESTLTKQLYEEFKRKNTNWKRLKWVIFNKIRRLHGETHKRFSIFGFPLYTRTKTNEYHTNLYILCLPLLRINQIGATTTVHFLPAVWLCRVVQKIFNVLIRRLKKEDLSRRE